MMQQLMLKVIALLLFGNPSIVIPNSILYVQPNSTAVCPPSTVGWPCRTLDEYALNSTHELDNKDNVTMIFLPGAHNLTENLLTQGGHTFTVVGCCYFAQDSAEIEPIELNIHKGLSLIHI